MGKIDMTVHDKAIRLCEGGIVEIKENWFALIRFPKYFDDISCYECYLDSLCHKEHADICGECEVITQRRCSLRLVTNRRTLRGR